MSVEGYPARDVRAVACGVRQDRFFARTQIQVRRESNTVQRGSKDKSRLLALCQPERCGGHRFTMEEGVSRSVKSIIYATCKVSLDGQASMNCDFVVIGRQLG